MDEKKVPEADDKEHQKDSDPIVSSEDTQAAVTSKDKDAQKSAEESVKEDGEESPEEGVAEVPVPLTENSHVKKQHIEQPEAQHNKRDKFEGSKQTGPLPHRSKKSVFLIFALTFVNILLISGFSYGAFWAHKKISEQATLNDSVIQDISVLHSEINAKSTELAREQARYSNTIAEYDARIASAEQRLQAQQKRILSMSTTSREDWLLAEAEYLLKLGNQRVLVERKAESAIALFEEADGILRDLADPDLFPLREVIKKDLVALKLAEKIDVEGIYLELAALANQVDQLPIVPEAFNYQVAESELESEELSSTKNSFARFLESFKNYFRVMNHEEKPAAMLPPDATAYLHLNLRMMIERAQLAMLREQENIYYESLKEAQRWISKYFPNSSASMQYKQSLEVLAGKDIISVLPDVSESLELLNGYISDLHKLSTVSPSRNTTSENTYAKQEAL